MLQRIQTVFLLLIALFMGATLILPLWVHDPQDEGMRFLLNAFYYQEISKTPNVQSVEEIVYFPFSIVACLALASLVVTIIEISKFKNRLLQMKLGALNSLLMAGTIGCAVYFATDLMSAKQVQGSYGIGLFMPAVAMICNVIANRFIRKDERLVRSVDRIR